MFLSFANSDQPAAASLVDLSAYPAVFGSAAYRYERLPQGRFGRLIQVNRTAPVLTLSVLETSYDRPAGSLRTGVTGRSDFAPTAGQFVAGLSWINVPLARRNSIENAARRVAERARLSISLQGRAILAVNVSDFGSRIQNLGFGELI